MVWKKESGINCFGIKGIYIILYSEFNITSPSSYHTYLVSFENLSCTCIEEKLIECSAITARNNYDCIFQPGKYIYATIDCIPGIYIIPIMS